MGTISHQCSCKAFRTLHRSEIKKLLTYSDEARWQETTNPRVYEQYRTIEHPFDIAPILKTRPPSTPTSLSS